MAATKPTRRRSRATDYQDLRPHRAGYTRGPLPAPLLAARVSGQRSSAGPCKADQNHERGVYALSRRKRHAPCRRVSLRPPRHATVRWLGRGRLHPLCVSRVEIRSFRPMCRTAGGRHALRRQDSHPQLSDRRIPRTDICVSSVRKTRRRYLAILDLRRRVFVILCHRFCGRAITSNGSRTPAMRPICPLPTRQLFFSRRTERHTQNLAAGNRLGTYHLRDLSERRHPGLSLRYA